MRSITRIFAATGLLVTLGACSFSLGGTGQRAGEVSALDLEAGLCFNDPRDEELVRSVSRVACEQPHDNEVFAVFDYTGQGDEFPGQEALGGQADEECEARFEDYVGIPYADSGLRATYLTPSEQTWADGDREIVCYLYEGDAEPLTGSMKDSGR